MEYFLMRKDAVITLCDFTPEGQMISYASDFLELEKAPLEYRSYPDHLKRWWTNRQIATGRKGLEEVLQAKGFTDYSSFLLKNLGLSLTDYYWIKPVNSNLKWADVNLFDNDFKENIMRGISDGFSPNSSLGGELEKSWIVKNGKRCLIKGNHGELSSESINEVIASQLHASQNYDNFTEYKLIKIKNKPYDWGCFSEAFTSQDVELVSAHALLTSEKRSNGISRFNHLINIAEKHGIEANLLWKDLAYQILTDYILSNTDRHMENIGFLRDAKTLKLIRMAPIFDTGRAMGARGVVPYTEEEIQNIEVNSFETTERGLLSLVFNPPTATGAALMNDLVDISRLPDSDHFREMYHQDSKMRAGRIDSILHLYETKVKSLKDILK